MSNDYSDEDEDYEDEEYEDEDAPFDSWAYVPGLIILLIGIIQLVYDQWKGNVNDTLLIGGIGFFGGLGLLLLVIGFLLRLRRD